MVYLLSNPRQLWKRYLIAMAFIALFATTSHVAVLYASSTADGLANTINLSGRQRMLSQRILYLASQTIAQENHGVATARSELRDAVGLFERSHDALVETDRNIDLKSLSEELKTLYFSPAAGNRLDVDVRRFIRDAYQVLDDDRTIAEPAFRRLAEQGQESLLTRLDRAVLAFERMTNESVGDIKHVAEISFYLVLIGLLGELLFIFWPAHISIKNNLDALEAYAARLEQSEAEARQLLAKVEETTNELVVQRKEREMQRQLVSMVSHEFRTPLAIIDGAAHRIHRMNERIEKTKADRLIGSIRGAVTRLTGLIESVLYADQLSDKGFDLRVGECQLQGLLGDVCERQRSQTPTHKIELDLGDAPDRVIADEKLLDHVFTNLLSNAVRYSPKSDLVQVRCWQEGDLFSVSVTDFGVGIPEEEIPRISERFFRASTSAGIQGTGIGLNLVKTIVEMHGGSITLESRVAEGSTFTVTLFISGPDAASEPPDRRAAGSDAGTSLAA